MLTIRQWLESIGLERYSAVLESEEVDVESLPHVTAEDLKELGIPLGPRRRILGTISSEIEKADTTRTSTSMSISGKTHLLPATTPTEAPPIPTKASLKTSSAAGPDLSKSTKTEHRDPTPRAVVEAERRQLTVMFCDLVGSTELSTKFDPEVLREMMGAYQTAAGAVIDSYDGHVAQYLGDGVMVYFGWPHAHEDDAVRAVQAGLDVIDSIKRLDVPTELSVRVGIATGPVVVGETGGGDPSVPKTAVGETPNLAARVQGIAEPNTVAIGGITRGLIGAAFELDSLGAHTLKGIAKPVELYRVIGDKGAESRFEATYADHLTPVVGRDSEIALQLDRWQRAKDGEGQVILLNGEPGIGKSRLIHMLREKLAEDSYTPIRYQCSTHHSNSAFYPAIDQFERAAGFTREDSNDAKLDKLEILLQQSAEDVSNVARLFASLLSLPTDRYPTIDATPQQLKEQTIGALNDQLLGLASKDPVVFLIEDAHWCDPTTMELIGDAITRIIDARILLIITHRPEFEAPWTGHAHVSVQTLNRLSRRESSEVVEKVTGGKSLPKEVLDLIVAKTDGIPLYVEELTKNVLEAGFLKDASDHYELDGPLPALAIPATLQESLIARLDRLNTVKTIAQIGACIGREFSHELVATVSLLSDSELQSAFRQLIESQIILPQGGAARGSYIFKHALLQDAAYDSLLRAPKRQFHSRIADGLLSKFPDVVGNTPELLASHLSKAERFSEAVDHWKEAGLRAKNASSNQEAAHYFEAAIKILGEELPSPLRDKRELELQAPLALAMTALHGYASPKTGEVYERAFALSRNVENPPELFQIMYGLSSNRLNGERFTEGLSIAKELAAYSDTAGEKVGYTIAHRWYAQCLLWVPDFEKAKSHLEKALEAYEEANFYRWVDEYGQDPKSLGLSYLSVAHNELGYFDQGIKLKQEAIAHTQTLNFPFGLALAHWIAAYSSATYNDLEEVRANAVILSKIADENDFPYHRSSALLLLGWADHQENKPGAFAKVQRGMDEMDGLSSNSMTNFFPQRLLVESLIKEGENKTAGSIIDRVLNFIEPLGSNWLEADFWRLKALNCLSGKHCNRSEVESLLLRSLKITELHKQRHWGIKTVLSLAKFWIEGEERRKAYELLHSFYSQQSEGFGTPNMIEAKALLKQLQ